MHSNLIRSTEHRISYTPPSLANSSPSLLLLNPQMFLRLIQHREALPKHISHQHSRISETERRRRTLACDSIPASSASFMMPAPLFCRGYTTIMANQSATISFASESGSERSVPGQGSAHSKTSTSPVHSSSTSHLHSKSPHWSCSASQRRWCYLLHRGYRCW